MNETTNTTEPQIAYSECYVQPFFTFYNADNMAIMKTFKDKEFDLVNSTELVPGDIIEISS